MPLDRESSCIRLLTLQQGEGSSIECNLEVCPISRCPSFIALSYTWGPPAVGWEIVLDGKKFRVRSNLYKALQAIINQKSKAANKLPGDDLNIDRPETWKYFWIDAICIDQENLLERNHQVNMMKQIFRNSKFVLAWLGEASGEEEEEEEEEEEGEEERTMMAFSTRGNRQWGADEDKKMGQLLNSLFRRDYWERMWIVQEIILAQDLLILCGNQTLKWGIVNSWSEDRYLKGEKMGEKFGLRAKGGYGIFLLTRDIQRRRALDLKLSLPRLFTMLCGQKCSDVRDRIYGLLGLMEDHHRLALHADYSLTKEQLFERVTKHLAFWFPPQNMEERERLQLVLRFALNVSINYSQRCFEESMPKIN
jgi:Heterokaryon incompatibility protein (HET)